MKNALLFATLVTLIIVGCGQKTTVKSQPIIVCGEVIKMDSTSSKVITVFSYEATTDHDRFVTNLKQTNGKFHNKFYITHTHDMGINYGGVFYRFMGESGDSIHVSINAQTKEVVYSGDYAEFNNQLNKVAKVAFAKFPQTHPIFNLDTTVDGMVLQIKERMKPIEDTLDIYCRQNNIMPEVKKYEIRNNLYGLANYILDFKREQEFTKERFALKTHEIFDIHNPTNAQSYMHAIHISNMTQDFIASDPELQNEVMKDEQDVAKISRLMLEMVLRQPKSPARDILITQTVQTLNQFADSVAMFYDARYLNPTTYHFPAYMELYVRPIFEPQKSEQSSVTITRELDMKGDISYINKKNEVESFESKNIIEYLTQKYKGKVLYIDVWATWCGPCLIEMEYAKDAHKIYDEMDDVVFVNICMQSSYDEWITTIENKSIDGENYLINNSDVAKLILANYNLPGYPSYLLINKEGKMITTHAPRPSEMGLLSDQINKLL